MHVIRKLTIIRYLPLTYEEKKLDPTGKEGNQRYSQHILDCYQPELSTDQVYFVGHHNFLSNSNLKYTVQYITIYV